MSAEDFDRAARLGIPLAGISPRESSTPSPQTTQRKELPRMTEEGHANDMAYVLNCGYPWNVMERKSLLEIQQVVLSLSDSSEDGGVVVTRRELTRWADVVRAEASNDDNGVLMDLWGDLNHASSTSKEP